MLVMIMVLVMVMIRGVALAASDDGADQNAAT